MKHTWFQSILLLMVVTPCWASAEASLSDQSYRPSVIAASHNVAEILESAGVKDPSIAVGKPTHKQQALAHYLSLLPPLSEPAEDEIEFADYKPISIFVGHSKPKKTRDFYQISYASITHLPKQIEAIGKLFGDAVVANKNAKLLNTTLAQYAHSNASTPITFMIIIGKSKETYVIAGAKTFISQPWEMVGGKNIVSQTAWLKASLPELQSLVKKEHPQLMIIGKSDAVLQKDFPQTKIVSVNPDIFFTYSPKIIDPGLSEAKKITDKL